MENVTKVLTKTKEQITKRQQEIARLQAEVKLLEAKLEQQQKLVNEFNEAKELMRKAAQDLIDSQYFEYDEVVEDCKTVVTSLNEGVGTKPIKLQTINKVKPNNVCEAKNTQVSTFAKSMNKATDNINKLSEDIDKGIVSKEEAARLLMKQIDDIIEVTKPKKEANEVRSS